MESTIKACIGDIKARTEAVSMNVMLDNTQHSRKDSDIVELYWQRDESAISETQKKYNAYLTKIAQNILANTEDSEESVNDTYLKAWDSMPSHRPEKLATYLGKIIRNLSINTLRNSSRQKRQGSQRALSLSELEDCIPSDSNPEHQAEVNLLTDKINEWLRTVSAEMAKVFIGRYYFMDSVKSIAVHYSMSESKVKVTLHRSRLGLKDYLEKEGFTI
jgi:RNA polymerase sigma-70 factor (ECF subfamily)